MTVAYTKELGVLSEIMGDVIEAAPQDLKWFSFEV